MDTSKQPSGRRYFNLDISGVGYLNDIRDVELDTGNRFLSVRIRALLGPDDKVEYQTFDCVAVGAEAKGKLMHLKAAGVAGDRKVLAQFRLSGLTVRPFVYPASHERRGETGFNLKSRLVALGVVKVDGVPVAAFQPPGPTRRESAVA